MKIEGEDHGDNTASSVTRLAAITVTSCKLKGDGTGWRIPVCVHVT